MFMPSGLVRKGTMVGNDGIYFVDCLSMACRHTLLMMKTVDVNFTANRPHLQVKDSCLISCWSLSCFASQCLRNYAGVQWWMRADYARAEGLRPLDRRARSEAAQSCVHQGRDSHGSCINKIGSCINKARDLKLATTSCSRTRGVYFG